MTECVFCKILEGVLPGSFIYRDDVCSVFLDIHPINPGHALVIPNRHATRISELTEQESAHLFKVGKKISSAIEKTDLRCEGVNFFISDGESAGQEVPHAHLHIVPRFPGDGQRVGFSHSSSQREELEVIARELKEKIER